MVQIQKRYVITLLTFLGYVFISILQKSMASAFVQMRVKRPDGGFNFSDDEMDYNITRIMQANTIGFMITFIGGAVATTFGGSVFFGSGIGLSACIAILCPLLVRAEFKWVLRVKYVDGLLQGLAFCGIADIWARWSRLEERATQIGFAMSGIFFGSFIQHTIPYLAKENLIKYSTTFTVTGVTAVMWSVVWLLNVRSDPSKDEKLSENERKKLAMRIKYVGTERVHPEDYPWKEIITSKPVWAVFTVSFLTSCALSVGSIHIPNHMYSKKYISSTIYDAIPIVMDGFTTIYMCLAGLLCDWARKKYLPVQVHRCFVGVGLGISAIFPLLYLLIQSYWFIFLYALYPIGIALCEIGFIVNVVDMSPRYASLISGFEITFFTAGTLMGNYFIRFATKEAVPEYLLVAFSLLFCCGGVIYYFWASPKLQLWNQIPRDPHSLMKQGSTISQLPHQSSILSRV